MADPSASEPGPLAGRWRRVSDSDCARAYPAGLVIGPGSRYRAVGGGDQGLPVWDVGTARMPDGRTLTMSTSSDELVSYRLEATADRFTVTTPDGCTLTYERED